MVEEIGVYLEKTTDLTHYHVRLYRVRLVMGGSLHCRIQIKLDIMNIAALIYYYNVYGLLIVIELALT
jgi:hypothetical protein